MPQPNIKESILVRMLAVLSTKQLKGFQAYLSCGLFNTNSTLENLFQYLRTKALKAPEKPLWQSKMAADLQLSEKIIDKLFSQLLQHLNRFVYQWRNRANTNRESADTLQFWVDQGLPPDLVEREYRKMKRKVEAAPASDADLYNLLQLEHQYAVFQVFQPRKDQGTLFATHHELLDQYYWVTKLKYLCASENATRILRQSSALEVVVIDEAQVQTLPPIGQAYYQTYRLLTAPNPGFAEMEALYHFLRENGANIHGEDQRNLYGFLLNVNFRTVRKGHPEFEELGLRIYEASLAAGILIQHGKMPSAHFKNIVSLKSRLRSLEETKVFIQAHQENLPATDREELLAYCYGLLDFYHGNYHSAIQQFRSIVRSSTEDLFWGLEARNMLWKAYFEGGETLSMEDNEEMLKLYDSFRLYVARNSRITDHQKTCYENFIRIFNQLIRTDEKGRWASSKAEYETILKELREASALMNKSWLLDVVQRKIIQFE